MIDVSPLPRGEGGESSEPGEGPLPAEPRNFGIWDYLPQRRSRYFFASFFSSWRA
jgi:hypothetical protein